METYNTIIRHIRRYCVGKFLRISNTIHNNSRTTAARQFIFKQVYNIVTVIFFSSDYCDRLIGDINRYSLLLYLRTVAPRQYRICRTAVVKAVLTAGIPSYQFCSFIRRQCCRKNYYRYVIRRHPAQGVFQINVHISVICVTFIYDYSLTRKAQVS